MKTAIDRAGVLIEADKAVEDRAVCAYCGDLVALRRRRLMGGGWVAYWRHPNNSNLSCPGRSRRVISKTKKKNTAASPQRLVK